MYVYLDESGDTGFKFKHGSTRFFVVTLLIVDDPEPIRSAIAGLRNQLSLPWHREFHFVHCSNEIRKSFLRCLGNQQVCVRAVVIDKAQMTRPHMRKSETFYNFVVKMVLQNDGGTISNATLIVDQSFKSKRRKDSATVYLRRELNSSANRRIKQIQYRQSHKEDLLQAADMVSGAINRKFAKSDEVFFDLIESRVQDLWVWRPYSQD